MARGQGASLGSTPNWWRFSRPRRPLPRIFSSAQATPQHRRPCMFNPLWLELIEYYVICSLFTINHPLLLTSDPFDKVFFLCSPSLSSGPDTPSHSVLLGTLSLTKGSVSTRRITLATLIGSSTLPPLPSPARPTSSLPFTGLVGLYAIMQVIHYVFDPSRAGRPLEEEL